MADNGAQRRGKNVDEVIANKDQTNETVRFAQQLFDTFCLTIALLGHMTQAIAVQRHHAGFRTGEIGGDDHHDDQRHDQRGGGDMFHLGFLKDLAHELLQYAATKVGQRQQPRASHVKPDDPASAPPFMIVAPKQDDINEPRNDRQHCFINVFRTK